jgi:hypothetical protein
VYQKAHRSSRQPYVQVTVPLLVANLVILVAFVVRAPTFVGSKKEADFESEPGFTYATH